MKVKLRDLTKAVAKIQAIVSQDKTVSGVMFDISDNGLKVCFSDTRKAMIEEVDAVIEDGDIKDKIVLDYQRLVNAITICQPSGRLRIHELHFEFTDDGKVTLHADKMLLVKGEDGEDEEVSVSTFEQLLTWQKAGSNMRTAILSRENYDIIFEPEDESKVDEWDAKELRDILIKTSTEKGKQIYVSPVKQMAFVANTAYATTINVEDRYVTPISISTATGKSIADIINRLDSESLIVHTVGGKYIKIFSPDKKFGMSFELVPGSRQHLSMIDAYQNKDYSEVQLTFFKEVLQNVVKSATAVSASEKVSLKLGKNEDGQIELIVEGNNTNASIANNYKILTNGMNFSKASGKTEDDILKEFEIPISLKVLSDIIDKCDEDYIAFDVCGDSPTAKAIRIGGVDIDKVIEENQKASGGELVSEKAQDEHIEEEQDTTVHKSDIGEAPSGNITAVIEDTKTKKVYEIEPVKEGAVKTSKEPGVVTMEDKIAFRERTLSSRHYTLTAK